MSSGRNIKKENEALASIHFNKGQTVLWGINGEKISLDIVGIYPNKSFISTMNNVYSEGMTASSFYDTVDTSQPYIIISENTYNNLNIYSNDSRCSILQFNEINTEDISYLKQNSIVISGSDVYRNSKNEVYKDLKNFYPIIISLSVIFLWE